MSGAHFSTYEEFVFHLEDREYFGLKLGLERIERLLDRLGNPHRQFPVVHVAGTNGKGSTVALIDSILQAAGYRVGRYTSPHLTDFCERICVGGEEILQDRVVQLVRAIREAEEEPLTFFELATAIAFLHFARSEVQIVVVETGLGGRLDATNVGHPLVTAITTIGLDHTQHLGSSLREIASEKGGIIKEGVPVAVGNLPAEALRVIREIADRRRAPLCLASLDSLPADLYMPLQGDHQRWNAAVAVAVIERLREQGWKISEELIRTGLARVAWPGRLETVQDKPWVLLDGAHNPDAMRSVADFLKQRLAGRRLKVVFGAMADKDIQGILAEIAPLTSEFILTAPRLNRAADPKSILEMVRSFRVPARIVEGVEPAVAAARADLKNNEGLLITGSLFVVGEARRSFAAK